ncbi:hypothetical protein DYB32_009783 [Aphanomyces invadans]|uniref:RRM domain-containing protein n=1 Tax=Aphanomyces invadans TaxID=157072 RepID=A0A3R6YXB9_9STRA|nr:hypothetical protein DYB32_009783 [Aphanomyces invadans]
MADDRDTTVAAKKAAKKQKKQQKKDAGDVEDAPAVEEPTTVTKKSSKKQKKATKEAEEGAPTVELVPELASFFSTSSQVFGKRVEPEIKLPVATTPAPEDEAAPEPSPTETTAAAPTESKVATAKKVKKPKHKKVKAMAEAAAAAAAAAGETVDGTTAVDETASTTAKGDDDGSVDEKDVRTIFVGNVSLEATPNDLKKHFTPCGKVESVRLRSVPVAGCKVDQNGKQNLVKKVCTNKKLFVEGRDSCNAYVVFVDESSVDAALQLNGSKCLRVDRKNVSMDAKRTVFVGNLAFTATDDDVRNHFEKALREDADTPAVESVRIIRDKSTHLGKGFGYDVSTAAKALSLHESKMGKREIRVTVCGKRFKNTGGEKAPELKFEGRRARPGAQLRMLKKRKAGELTDAPPSKKSTKHNMAPFVKGEKRPSAKTFAKGEKKAPISKKRPGAKGLNAFKKGPRKPYQDKSKKGTTKHEKIKKPKHAARKARQALEAAQNA